MKKFSWSVVGGMVACAVSGVALAQVQPVDPSQVPEAVRKAHEARMAEQAAKQASESSQAALPPPTPVPAAWSDEELGRLGEMLLGTWKSSSAIQQGDDPTRSTHMVLGIGHVNLPGLHDAMYVEAARADSMHRPTRQAIWQLYKRGGKPRLRTFEFRRPGGENLGVVSMWAAPEYFPQNITMENLIGTLDLELSLDGGTLSGRTPHAYPTGLAGAVEMTSELKVSGGALSTRDVGYSASGSVAWGPGEGTWYEFTKSARPFEAQVLDGGLIVFNYGKGSGDMAASDGMRAAVHYVGALTDGFIFDSSRDSGRPFTMEVGQRLGVDGFTNAIRGLRKGDMVRAVIPPNLGYGMAGNRRSRIPPGATIVYEVEVMDLEAAAPVVAPDEAAEKQKQSMEQGPKPQ